MALDTSIYERQRRNATDQYSQQSAINALGRFNSQTRTNRGTTDYTQNFQRQAPKFTASYARRGLTGGGVQSGVYQNAMRNYVGDYSQGLNRMYADQQSELNQYDLNAANLQTNYQNSMADLEVDKAKEIALAAQQLTALKSQFGG
jgi:hypothetical protein